MLFIISLRIHDYRFPWGQHLLHMLRIVLLDFAEMGFIIFDAASRRRRQTLLCCFHAFTAMPHVAKLYHANIA